jgi:uncharacterized membrane protein YheB (UPF0754 family)
MDEMIWLIPILNAWIAAGCVALLPWMLFHPERRIRLLVIDWQGIIPKFLPEWKVQLAEAAAGLVNVQQLKEKVLQDDNKEAIQKLLESKVDDFLDNKLKEKIPVLSMFFTEGLRKQIRTILIDELMNMLPAVMNQVASHAEKNLNISSILKEKLEVITVDFIHEKYKIVVEPSLRKLQFAVAVFAFILGWIEVWLIQLA